MRTFKLSTTSDLVVVDDTDYLRCALIPWRLNVGRTGIIGRGLFGMTTLARFILNTKEEVDHIDGDILNNVRSNLRCVTKSQNGHNKHAPSHNTSGYKGVHWNAQKNKWQARITYTRNGIQQTKHIGFYTSAEMAARNYNIYAKLLLGEYVKLNEVSNEAIAEIPS